VPWIGIPDARRNHGARITTTAQTVTPQGLANSAARLLPKGTVCLSRTASVGYVTVADRLLLKAGDVLFNRTNSIELAGRAAVYDGMPPTDSFEVPPVRKRPHEYRPPYERRPNGKLALVIPEVSDGLITCRRARWLPSRWTRIPKRVRVLKTISPECARPGTRPSGRALYCP